MWVPGTHVQVPWGKYKGSGLEPSGEASWKQSQSPPRGWCPGCRCRRRSFQSKRNGCRWRCRCQTSSGARSPGAAGGAWRLVASRLPGWRKASPCSVTPLWRLRGRCVQVGWRPVRSKWPAGCWCCSLTGWCQTCRRNQICCGRLPRQTGSTRRRLHRETTFM